METRVNTNGIKQMRMAVSSPEKAGVGGSTPSLATIFSIRYATGSPVFSPN